MPAERLRRLYFDLVGLPTDPAAVENKFHTHDLHATVLHLLGLDHTRLTYQYAGRDFRLTDVHGRIAHDIIG